MSKASEVHGRGGTRAGKHGEAGPERHAGGRRPGETRTREAILTAARTCFADRGFDATSLRRIAETAGVDQALVHHFYGTKQNLFIQALELPGMMQEAITEAARGDIRNVGVRMVRAHMSVWDDVSARPILMTMVRSAAIHQAAAAQLRDTATGILTDALHEVIIGEDADLRSSLIATQLVGLALMRYVLTLEPLASADSETVARHYGPALQALMEDSTATQEQG